jgi:hypothetical protein
LLFTAITSAARSLTRDRGSCHSASAALFELAHSEAEVGAWPSLE